MYLACLRARPFLQARVSDGRPDTVRYKKASWRARTPASTPIRGKSKVLLQCTLSVFEPCIRPQDLYNKGYPLGTNPSKEEIMGAIVEKVTQALAALRRLGAEALNRHLEYCELLAEAQRRWY